VEEEKKGYLWYYCSEPASACEAVEGDCDKCKHKAAAEDRQRRGVTGRNIGKMKNQ